jgi:PadR family transcriptional regulator PadR
VRYGVELARRLGAETALATSEGTLYPMLSRLRRAGWVATTWQESPAGPPRRYYTLTPTGHAALAHFKVEWATFRDAVDRIVGTEHR